MGVIHIENVDDRIMNSIRLRADASGRSFEDEVKAVLEHLATPRLTGKELAAEAKRIRQMTPKGVQQTDSTEMIREFRDRGYSNL